MVYKHACSAMRNAPPRAVKLMQTPHAALCVTCAVGFSGSNNTRGRVSAREIRHGCLLCVCAGAVCNGSNVTDVTCVNLGKLKIFGLLACT